MKPPPHEPCLLPRWLHEQGATVIIAGGMGMRGQQLFAQQESQVGESNDIFFGRMNDPTAAAVVRGPCGDEMEFYLVIRDGMIKEVRCYTDGCAHTRTCGLAVARRARGKTILDALGINPKEIIDSRECTAEEGRHCAILAVTTLYRAIADYLLMP